MQSVDHEHNLITGAWLDQLNNLIPMDSGGECTNAPCDYACLLQKSQAHFFAIVIDTSVCPGFVPKLYWALLQMPIIPVVFGIRNSNFKQKAPRESYIDADEFKDTKSLLKHMDLLSKNEALYKSFFQWKLKFAFSEAKEPLCQLCSMLHQDLPPKSYGNVSSWFFLDDQGQLACPVS